MIAAFLTFAMAVGQDVGAPPGRLADQEALAPIAAVVGDWRGAGQVRRGSTAGAWRESSSWSWDLSRDEASLVLKVEDGRFLKSGRLRPDPETPGAYLFEATLADETAGHFAGRPDNRGRLALEATDAPDGEGVARITLTPLHETRLLVLYESRRPGTNLFTRLGEVGCTREGVAFATGDGQPVCIVTGGRGTIPVTHGGKTYYVCCSGCRDLFEEDPEAVIAEAEADGP